MDKERLKEILLTGKIRLYSVLDGAAIPGLLQKLYDTGAPHYCLFRGELTPDVAHYAPYIVRLSSKNEITQWVFEKCSGKNAGIFLHSKGSIRDMRTHFQSLVKVHDENSNPLIFRFYDPRVLRPFLPTCEGDELKTFFGGVRTFFAETEDQKSLISYSLDNGSLKQTTIDNDNNE